MTLQNALERFRQWCEGCPCHRIIFEELTEAKRVILLRRECGLAVSDGLADFRKACFIVHASISK